MAKPDYIPGKHPVVPHGTNGIKPDYIPGKSVKDKPEQTSGVRHLDIKEEPVTETKTSEKKEMPVNGRLRTNAGRFKSNDKRHN